MVVFFFSSRRRHTRLVSDWSSDVCSSDLPWLLAHVGDIDVTGHRRPASYHREIVFGLRPDPYLAVQRPERAGRELSATPWAWSDTVGSWAFSGAEGTPLTVEVHSDADEVELLL